jgi:hypothetical protein
LDWTEVSQENVHETPAIQRRGLATLLAKDPSTMNLRSLLLLVAVASLLFAKTAQAGLGWTFAECTKHWGYPVKQPVLNEFGLKECTFNGRPTFEAIPVSFSPEGKAICIIYMSPDAGTIDEMQDAIMKNNFPGASWSPDVPRNTEALKFWSAKENGVEVGYAVRTTWNVTYTIFQVGTEQFRTDYVEKRNTGKSSTDF